jgi:predicted alpha/beta-fold hydrolase
VEAIDERITAPSFGFAGAAEYYRTQSAIRYVDRIRVPTLLLQARDDHFVPFDIFESRAVSGNPRIEVVAPPHGGHLGFIGCGSRRFWSDHAVLEWIGEQKARLDRIPQTGS